MSAEEREVNLIKGYYPESWSLNWEPIGDGMVHIQYSEVHAEGTPPSALDIVKDYALAIGPAVQITIEGMKVSMEADLPIVLAYGFCLGELIVQALRYMEPAKIVRAVETLASIFPNESINLDEFSKIGVGVQGSEKTE